MYTASRDEREIDIMISNNIHVIFSVLFSVSNMVSKFWKFPRCIRNEVERRMGGGGRVGGGGWVIDRFQCDKSLLCEGVFVQRLRSELSASYWSFLDCIARARVEWGYVRRGQEKRWKRKGMDGTREEETADLTIWWGERRWCSAVALWGCWPST